MAQRRQSELTLADLTFDPRNARKRTPRSANRIAHSLEKLGAARSIVIDEEGRILAGNGTVEAAAEVGIDRVMVVETDGRTLVAVRRTGLSEKEKVELAIADNRTAELSTWDNDVLLQLDEEFDLGDWFLEGELTADNWESDIDAIEKIEEDNSPAKGRLTISFDEADREEVREVITNAIEEHGLRGVTVA